MGKTTNIIAAAVAGLAAGLVIGLLIAPEKGSKTRKKIHQMIDDLKVNAGEEFADQLEKLRNLFNEDESVKEEPTVEKGSS